MGRDLWARIKSHITAVDGEADRPRVPFSDPGFDRSWRLRPILQAVLEAARRLATPGAHVTLDEGMICSKGMCCLAGLAAGSLRTAVTTMACQFASNFVATRKHCLSKLQAG